jgi:succinate-semialdehyde dehydrogenase/glutarate-semialdehyde dehydrogenase
MTPVSELISVRHTDLYINGSWGPAADGQRIDVQDPATGEVIATVASASVQDALAAVQAAADAFRPWAARPPRQRAEILRKGFELMIRDQEKLAELMVRENGKPMGEARGEVAYAVPTASSSSTSRSACPCWSRRGISRRRWRPGRSGLPWPPAAPSS